MLISIVVPVCDAEATISRAIGSLLAQTWREWEAIIVVDDHVDYADLLRAAGLGDPRLSFISTGRHRSGCHRARNLGLDVASGDLIGALDADDAFDPRRLAMLAPIALQAGAAADNVAVIDDGDGSLMYPVMGHLPAPVSIDIGALLRLTAPLVPLIRREHALPRAEGVEYAEDVIGNLRLIDRLGSLVVVPAQHYQYRIRANSLANDDRAGDAFEQAYSRYIERVTTGDGFGIAPVNRAAAQAGLTLKRGLNREFQAALKRDRTLNFQAFVTRTRHAPG